MMRVMLMLMMAAPYIVRASLAGALAGLSPWFVARRPGRPGHKRCTLPEPEPEHEPEQQSAFETEVEITDLDPRQQRRRPVTRGAGGQRLSPRTRLVMALCTLLGLVLLALLVLNPWHLAGTSQLANPSQSQLLAARRQVSSRGGQAVVAGHFTYLLEKNGLVSALWTRKKYIYLLWQQTVPPSSQLLHADQNGVYLVTPDGSIIALRSRDGTLFWSITIKEQENLPQEINSHSPFQSKAALYLLRGVSSDAR
jgi:hypothetical protein